MEQVRQFTRNADRRRRVAARTGRTLWNTRRVGALLPCRDYGQNADELEPPLSLRDET